jgi:hypothetical protein
VLLDHFSGESHRQTVRTRIPLNPRPMVNGSVERFQSRDRQGAVIAASNTNPPGSRNLTQQNRDQRGRVLTFYSAFAAGSR